MFDITVTYEEEGTTSGEREREVVYILVWSNDLARPSRI